jgi:hypothetical protein
MVGEYFRCRLALPRCVLACRFFGLDTGQQAKSCHRLPAAEIPQAHRHGRRSRLIATLGRRALPLWISYSAPTGPTAICRAGPKVAAVVAAASISQAWHNPARAPSAGSQQVVVSTPCRASAVDNAVVLLIERIAKDTQAGDTEESRGAGRTRSPGRSVHNPPRPTVVANTCGVHKSAYLR